MPSKAAAASERAEPREGTHIAALSSVADLMVDSLLRLALHAIE
ncbi:MAG: hypothetical protein ACTHU7_10220 [Microbacterium sp.]